MVQIRLASVTSGWHGRVMDTRKFDDQPVSVAAGGIFLCLSGGSFLCLSLLWCSGGMASTVGTRSDGGGLTVGEVGERLEDLNGLWCGVFVASV